MALAPLSSLAGIFIDPIASTLAPFILYFIFRNKREKVARVALQTADLAFSMQLWIVLVSLALMLGISMNLVTPAQSQQMMVIATLSILGLFIISLLTGLFHTLNGQSCRYYLSFRLAERVLELISKK